MTTALREYAAHLSDAELVALIDGIEETWREIVAEHGESYRKRGLYLHPAAFPQMVPYEARCALYDEKGLRDEAAHAVQYAADVAMPDPVEVLSDQDQRWHLRCWSYSARTPDPYGCLRPLRGISRAADHPRTQRHYAETMRRMGAPVSSGEAHVEGLMPAVWRSDTVRVGGQPVPRARIRQRMQARAALMRILRD